MVCVNKKKAIFVQLINSTHQRVDPNLKLYMNHKNELRLFGVLLFFLLTTSFSHAQGVVNYSSDFGLSSTTISQIMQDSRNNVWICTRDGLNRHDGVKINVYRHNAADEHSLSHNLTLCAVEMRPGDVLIGTEVGVQSYDYDKDRFITHPLINSVGDTIAAHVVSIVMLQDSSIYVCTAGFGCYKSRKDENGHLNFHETKEFNTASIVLHIHQDDKKRLWVVDGLGNIYRREGNTTRFIQHLNAAGGICHTDSGHLYIYTTRDGLYRFNELSRQFVQIPYNGVQPIISKITPAPHGRVLLSTDGSGLLIFDERLGKIVPSNIRTFEYNLAASNVKDAMVDADGNMWVGVYWKGVLVVPGYTSKFNYVGRRSVDKNMLGTNCVTSVYTDPHGELWVATDHCGVYHLDPSGNSSIHFKPEIVKGMVSTVLTMLEDSKGHFWLGSAYRGLALMNKQSGECTDFSGICPQAKEIDNVYALVEDHQGNLWIGTMGKGLYCYNLNTKELRHFIQKKTREIKYPYEVLGNSYIRSLKVHNNILYVGTADGMEIFTMHDGMLKYKGKSCLRRAINDIVLSRTGELWLATTLGLMRCDLNGDVQKSYAEEQGMPNASANSIEVLPDGVLWVATNYGLTRFAPDRETFDNYSAVDGLQGNEFSTQSSCYLGGKLYFGGINGLTFFDPKSLGDKENRAKLDLRVVDLYVNGRLVHGGDKSGHYNILQGWIANQKEVHLSSFDKNFSLELSTMNFSNQRVTYQYSVNGGDWIELEPGQNRISFTDVTSGTYRIRMRAKGYGMESEVHEIKVIVHSPWYASNLAFLAYFIILLFVAYLFYEQLRERLHAKKLEEKHKQAEKLNEARVQFFMNISHEIRTPMTLILSPLNKLMHLDTDELHTTNYSIIYQNVQRILRLINQLMDARKIEKGQFTLHYEKVELVSFIDNLYQLFAASARAHDVKFTFIHSMQQLYAAVDPQNFDKIVMNLLSNAFKFTPDGGTISIELRDDPVAEGEEACFTLMVTDSGVGIPKEQRERVFERFYSAKNDSGYVGTGIGLNLTRSLVELHDGHINITNNPDGQGTRFVVTMPQKAALYADGVEVILPEHSITSQMHDNLEREIEEMPVHTRDGRQHDYRMVIVEDDPAIRNYVRAEFISSYYVNVFPNGEEAWNYIVQNPNDIDVVVSDVMMPVMDGVELCDRLKHHQATKHIPLVMITALADDENKLKGLESGAEAYISKPFNIEVLRHTVANLIKAAHSASSKSTMAAVESGMEIGNTHMSAEDDLMRRVMTVLNKHLGDSNFSIELLAEETGLSRVHLHRRLKRITGQTPRDFLRNVRLSAAARMFVERKMDVTDVCYAVGFRSVSNFSTSFKALFGVSPSEYIQRHSGDNPEEIFNPITGRMSAVSRFSQAGESEDNDEEQ